MKQWKTRCIAIGAAILLLLSAIPVQGAEQTVPEELQQLYAQSAVLMDADSGRILFEKNGQQVRPMASTTKIMTLIIALENADLGSLVGVSEYAAGMPDVQLNIRKGEQYRLRDLLYSLMLESHNDSAVAIAEHVAAEMSSQVSEAALRSKEESKALVKNFAALMNAKARDIGCSDTHFVTPNGLDGEDEGGAHSTTAADLARILRYCITQSPQKEQFLEITRQAGYSFVEQSGSRSFSLQNHNAFLQMMEGALTGKTGFTSQAGYCYVGALTRDGKTYIAALLACGWPNHKSYKWSDMRKLMNYGLENYTFRFFEEAGFAVEQIEPVLVEGGQSSVLGEPVYVQVQLAREQDSSQAESSVSAQDQGGLLLREDETIQVKCRVEETLQAPVEAGEMVGSVQYLVDGQVFKTELLVAGEDVLAVDFPWCIRQILQRYFV